MIRLAHVYATDIGLSSTLPFYRPFLQRGWEVTVICPDGPRLNELRAAGVRWLPHPIRRQVHLPSDFIGSAVLLRHFRRHAFDVVHTHNAKIGLLGRALAELSRVPVVIHTHHGMIFSSETRWPARVGLAALERVVNLRADRVLVQSEEDRATLLECGAVAPHQIQVLGNGVDLSRFDPRAVPGDRRQEVRATLGVSPDEVLFLSAGRMVEEKGFVELFAGAAAARRSDPRIRLAVAGPTDDERGLGLDPGVLSRARGAGILLLGERSDMVELYAAADAVILASWREGLPRVLMEGAAMGKPLLAADARGCREVVRGDEHGRLFPLRDADAITQTMVFASDNARWRSRVGANNSRMARERFDVDTVVARLEQIYLSLLAKKGTSRHE